MIVKYTCVGTMKSRIPQFTVNVRLTDTVQAFKDHLQFSHNIAGLLKNEAGMQLDLSCNMKTSLQALGLRSNSVVVVESFKQYNRLQYSYQITIHVKNHRDIKFKVRSATDIDELRHIVQDKVGMPIEEQVYAQGQSSGLKKDVRVASRFHHGKDKLTLIWQPRRRSQAGIFHNTIGCRIVSMAHMGGGG